MSSNYSLLRFTCQNAKRREQVVKKTPEPCNDEILQPQQYKQN